MEEVTWNGIRERADELENRFFDVVFGELNAEYNVGPKRQFSIGHVTQGLFVVGWGIGPKGLGEAFEPVRRRPWLSRSWETVQSLDDAAAAIEARISAWVSEARDPSLNPGRVIRWLVASMPQILPDYVRVNSPSDHVIAFDDGSYMEFDPPEGSSSEIKQNLVDFVRGTLEAAQDEVIHVIHASWPEEVRGKLPQPDVRVTDVQIEAGYSVDGQWVLKMQTLLF